MSIISQALLQQLMSSGVAVLLVPESSLEVDDIEEAIEGQFRTDYVPLKKGRTRGFYSPVMPSPSPG